MKKQLIAIGLVSFLAVPSVVFAEGDACAPIMSEGMTEEAVMDAKSAAMNTSECMGQRLGSMEEFSHGHGVSLYGSFRTGLIFGAGDTKVGDLYSRWGFQGSAEVSEGLTAGFRYEAKINTANAESAGSPGHGHDAAAYFNQLPLAADHEDNEFTIPNPDEDAAEDAAMISIAITAYDPNTHELDVDKNGNIMFDSNGLATQTTLGDDGMVIANGILYFQPLNKPQEAAVGPVFFGPGGRLSYVDLSGGFGTIRLGQIWSASANHYYFKVDPSHYNGTTGGASTRNPNSISYSSSAGDVSFQIDKVTGDEERIEFGATAGLGPVGVSIAHWKSGADNDQSSFTGVALSAGAAGVNLTVGLGSSDDEDGMATDTSVLNLNGSVGDSGLSYGVQITNTEGDTGDQNLVALTNSLGSGASLIFEFSDPGGDGESTSLVGLRVDF